MSWGRWAFLALILVVVVRTAWLSDDALITLRTVLNATHGYGLTFNIAERVQTYTHPLWLGLLTVSYLVVGNIFYATFLLSLLVTAGVVWLILRSAVTDWQLWISGGVMVASRAFVDYSTSGLENPLTAGVVLAAFVCAAWAPSARNAGVVWLFVSAAYLTRPDAALLVLPVAFVVASRLPIRQAAATVALGLVPAVAWTMFALVYYGFALPNTAYAKLAAGIPLDERLSQGGLYLLDSLDRDPVTLVTIALAVALASRERGRDVAVAAGVVAYLAYVLWIGGDFMSGRFLAAPLAVSIWILATLPERPAREWGGVALVVALVALASPAVPLRSGSTFNRAEPAPSGIVDERGVHFHEWGLIRADRAAFAEPVWPEASAGAGPTSVLDTCGMMGATGLEWGPRTHLLDECALADPLLARLPSIWNDRWRPGHFRRMIPDGYRESLEQDTNALRDRGLASYYDALRLLTRSETLWSRDRLRTIARFARGKLGSAIDRRFYRHGGELGWLHALADPKPDGTPADGSGVQRFQVALAVPVEQRPGRRWLDISLDSNGRYRIVFLRRTRVMASLLVDPPPRAERVPGLMSHFLDVPARARTRGFDTVVIVLEAGPDLKAVGHLLLDGEAATDRLLEARRPAG